MKTTAGATPSSYDAAATNRAEAAKPVMRPNALDRDAMPFTAARPVVPAALDENAIVTTDEFCSFMRISDRTRREWARYDVGPRWWRFNGTGRLYTTAAELRRFLGEGM